MDAQVTSKFKIGDRTYTPGDVAEGDHGTFAIDNGFGRELPSEPGKRAKKAPANKAKKAPANKAKKPSTKKSRGKGSK